MTKPTADISVIICAYTEERWDALLAAAASIRDQTLQPLEVILVVDHNRPLFERAARGLAGVTCLQNQHRQGLSGARNTGIAAARGAWVAFMDEDAVASPDWIEQLTAGYKSPSVLGVGGAILPAWAEGRPGWFPPEFDWVVGCTYLGMPTFPAPVRNLIGCNMSFRRTIFERAGGFRVGMGRVGTLPVGCEETELCIRASQVTPEGVFLFVPAAQVWHQVPARRATWRYFLSRCYSEGLSKAQVARFSGARQGLASERSYTLRVLPAGVWRGLADFFRRGGLSGLGRASAIILGLTFTTAGYLAGSMLALASRRAQGPQEIPEMILTVPTGQTGDQGRG